MANKLYLQENLLIYKPAAAAQFYSGVAGTGTIDLAAWITEAAADGTITIAGGGGGAVTSVAGKTGVVTLGKTDVGLSNVDNTSDLNKPISTATQTALNTLPQGAESGLNIDGTSKKARLGGTLLADAVIDGASTFGIQGANLRSASLITDATGSAQSTLSLGTQLSQPTRIKTESVATPATKSELIIDADGLSSFYQKSATSSAGLQLTSDVEAAVKNSTYSIGVKTDGIYATTLATKSTETEVVYIDSTTGKLAKGAPSASSSVQQYSAGNNVIITATNTGVTATKAAGAWVITVPTGVVLIDAHVQVLGADVQTAADGSGVTNWVTVQVTGAGYNSGGSIGSVRIPVVQTTLFPIGAVAVNNSAPIASTLLSVIQVATNAITIRKSGMVSSNDYIMSLSGF
jgi:hypothetical protein